MSFKQCFMKVFTIFSSFEVWYISPLNTWKQQDLGFACFQGGKTSKFKSRKNRLKSTFSHIFFYRTYYFGKRHDMKQCTTFKNHFLKNTCNLRHSIGGVMWLANVRTVHIYQPNLFCTKTCLRKEITYF